MKNAIKHSKQEAMQMRKFTTRLRIDGAHVVIAENVINKWTFDRAIIRANDNKTPDIIRIAELLTLKPAWVIGGIIALKKPRLNKWRDMRNIHYSKFHYCTKEFDSHSTINDTWRTMEKPPYMRGIDFDRPELW